jgi:hypothetical protein
MIHPCQRHEDPSSNAQITMAATIETAFIWKARSTASAGVMPVSRCLLLPPSRSQTARVARPNQCPMMAGSMTLSSQSNIQKRRMLLTMPQCPRELSRLTLTVAGMYGDCEARGSGTTKPEPRASWKNGCGPCR